LSLCFNAFIFYKDECGVSYVAQNAGKIVGGVDAEPHSWPATAYIIFEYKIDILPDITFSFSES
jgi:hypothetical protein